MSGWQPIETAPRPKRGRRKVIDVWCVTDDHESAKFYFGKTCSGVKDQMMWQGRVSEVYWLDGAWRPATGLRMHGLTVTPTHWMPLPDAPTVDEGKAHPARFTPKDESQATGSATQSLSSPTIAVLPAREQEHDEEKETS